MKSKISNCIFGFQCDKSWDDLTKAENEKIRHCNHCKKEVHFCANPSELMDAISRDLCVAIDATADHKKVRLLGYPSGGKVSSFLSDIENNIDE